MRRAACLALVVGLVCGLSAPLHAAACTSTDSCLQQIEAAQRTTESLRARFTQTKYMSLLNEPLTATGRFAFKRPDRVLWEIEEPQKTTVIIAGGKLQIPGLPEKERESLSSLPVATALSQVGALFSGDVKVLREAFDATAEDVAQGIRVRLTPLRQDAQGMFSKIELTFVAPELTLRLIKLENSLGDRVEVALDDVTVNADVPDSLFAIPQ